MEKHHFLEKLQLSHGPKEATKFVMDVLFNKVYPMFITIRDKLPSVSEDFHEDVTKLRDVFALTTSQIRKCLANIFEIFKWEHKQNQILEESRRFAIERLSWCLNKLETIEQQLDNLLQNSHYTPDKTTDSITSSTMYFVNWIDHTFDLLSNLTNTVSKIDYKEINELPIALKIEISECVGSLHISLDELLLSAMTICRYCLVSDQHIVKARCQVVLRETKLLLNELIEGDVDAAFKSTPESLKLPIKPSNVNILIDVLKDVLYALETNTNTALLALLISCFSHNMSPVDVLKQHFKNKKDCNCATNLDTSGDCPFVNEFDLYNERLMQIGSFAVSCTSDQSRIVSLRSGLASLEALDPHLVPALLVSSDNPHSTLLVETWRQEVQGVRDGVFLIVDPGAFADKSKQLLHQKILDLGSTYDNESVCDLINIACVVYDFFSVYNNYEPEALVQRETLLPLLTDLRKVIMECKLVSNILSSGDDFVYNVKKINKTKKDTTFDQLVKRIKLLYSVINKINTVIRPKDNDDHFFDLDDAKNVTHTVNMKQINGNTYVNSPQKPAVNLTRSVFARTVNIRSSTKNFPLAMLTRHLKAKKCPELSFSTQLDQLFDDLSEVKESKITNKFLERVREPSILYKSPTKNRSSLRKAVLTRQKLAVEKENSTQCLEKAEDCFNKESFIDEAMSLQITDVLNQLDDVTNITVDFNNTQTLPSNATRNVETKSSNILRVNVNDRNTTFSKHVWNIPVNVSTVEVPIDNSVNISTKSANFSDKTVNMSAITVNMSANTVNMSANSNVPTLERFNDLNYVQSKLNDLKTQLETSL